MRICLPQNLTSRFKLAQIFLHATIVIYYCVSVLLFSLVPIIAVSVQTLPSEIDEGNLYEDTYLDLICDPYITESVDTAVSIFFTWTARDSNGESIDIGGGGYTITNQSNNSTLRIERLAIDRDNMAVYSCLVSVSPSSGSVYIIGSESNMGDITLTVNGKLCTSESCSNI